MTETIKEQAKYINERYPNAPLPGRVLQLKSTMKVHHNEEPSYEELLQALTGSEESEWYDKYQMPMWTYKLHMATNKKSFQSRWPKIHILWTMWTTIWRRRVILDGKENNSQRKVGCNS